MFSIKLNFGNVLFLSIILLQAILICGIQRENKSSVRLQKLFILPTKDEIAKHVKQRSIATFEQSITSRQRRQTRRLPLEDLFLNNLGLEDNGLTPAQPPTPVGSPIVTDDIGLPAPILIYRSTMNSGLRR